MEKLAKIREILLAKEIIKKAGLYIVEKKDLETLAEGAADAYQDYPLHNYLSKGKYDKQTSKLLMYASIKAMFKEAVIYADSPELKGFAVWLPFGYKGTKAIPFLFNGGLKLILHSGFGIIARLVNYDDYGMALKKEFTNNYDWYLFNLSVKPESQGKGIATKLIEPMLTLCDDKKMLAYLETHKESNVGLYKHFGFDLKKDDPIPKTNVKHYAMVRYAK